MHAHDVRGGLLRAGDQGLDLVHVDATSMAFALGGGVMVPMSSPPASQVAVQRVLIVTGVVSVPSATEARRNARLQFVVLALERYRVPGPVQDSGSSPGAVMSIPANLTVTVASLVAVAAWTCRVVGALSSQNQVSMFTSVPWFPSSWGSSPARGRAGSSS
jgi:hypothetical protein